MTLDELNEIEQMTAANFHCLDHHGLEVRIGDPVHIRYSGAELPHSLLGCVATVVGIDGKNAQVRVAGNPDVWPWSLPAICFEKVQTP